MALSGSNVAATLLNTLTTLNQQVHKMMKSKVLFDSFLSQGEFLVITRETAPILGQLMNICTVLADSAEVAAEVSTLRSI